MQPDEAAIGAVLDAMYAMISGPAGPRDWRRQPENLYTILLRLPSGARAVLERTAWSGS